MSHGLVEDFDLGGLTVHRRRWEPSIVRDDATPILLVHGLGANTVSWVTVGQRLADRRGVPVTALDLAGFGYTRALGTDASVQANADLVIAALRQMGPAIVMGNSMGGAITVKVAARRPDLLTAFVLVNPAIRHAGWRSPQVRQGAFIAPMLVPRLGTRVVTSRARQLGPEGLVDGTLQVVLSDPDRLDPEVRAFFVEIARARMEHPEAARAYVDAASSLFWYMSRNLDRDLAVALATIPGLMVFGTDDRIIHVSSAHAFATRHPTLDTVFLDGLGHAPQLEAPDRFVDVVDEWLARVAPGSA